MGKKPLWIYLRFLLGFSSRGEKNRKTVPYKTLLFRTIAVCWAVGHHRTVCQDVGIPGAWWGGYVYRTGIGFNGSHSRQQVGRSLGRSPKRVPATVSVLLSVGYFVYRYVCIIVQQQSRSSSSRYPVDSRRKKDRTERGWPANQIPCHTYYSAGPLTWDDQTGWRWVL